MLSHQNARQPGGAQGDGNRGGTLVFGCGYIGGRVAKRMLAASRHHDRGPVYTVTRSRERADSLARAGFEPIIADWTDRRTLRSLPLCGRTLVAVSFDPLGGFSREASQVGGLANLLDFVHAQTDLVYLSTTGVYHQVDGSWVDERSPARATYDGARAHLRAETLLQRRWCSGRWTVLRLAGIYGPGRIPRASDVLAGRPIDGATDGYLNLIHGDDAADAVIAAWSSAQGTESHPSRLYVVADDVPVVRRRFYEQIARLARVAPPQFCKSKGEVLSRRSASNKRIWNRRFRQELMPRLTYRSFVEGLSAIDWKRISVSMK